MGNINASVDLRRDGETAVVTVDNPPVNALKHEVRAGLAEALRRTRDDAAVKAVVFGWTKAAAGFRKTRHRGLARVGWMFTLTATAYNLVRLTKLVGAVA